MGNFHTSTERYTSCHQHASLLLTCMNLWRFSMFFFWVFVLFRSRETRSVAYFKIYLNFCWIIIFWLDSPKWNRNGREKVYSFDTSFYFNFSVVILIEALTEHMFPSDYHTVLSQCILLLLYFSALFDILFKCFSDLICFFFNVKSVTLIKQSSKQHFVSIIHQKSRRRREYLNAFRSVEVD